MTSGFLCVYGSYLDFHAFGHVVVTTRYILRCFKANFVW